jgi:lipoyl(octanoyl) transferase
MEREQLSVLKKLISLHSLGIFGEGESRVEVIDLGTRPYRDVWEFQQSFVEARVAGEISDLLIFVEHPPVITLGRGAQRGEAACVQAAPGTEVVEIERGGLATYHGPGQIVVYPVFQLARKHTSRSRAGVVNLIRALEDWVIATLALWEIQAEAIPSKTGVWVTGTPAGDRKIASIGIAVRRWVSFHGLALNYDTGVEPWNQLSPCGFSADVMTDLSEQCGHKLKREEILRGLLSTLPSTLVS